MMTTSEGKKSIIGWEDGVPSPPTTAPPSTWKVRSRKCY
jgi:hypothetical protein